MVEEVREGEREREKEIGMGVSFGGVYMMTVSFKAYTTWLVFWMITAIHNEDADMHRKPY